MDSNVEISLSIADLQCAHIERQEEWCPDQKPDLSFRGNELGGECGEALNVIKKLERERHGWRGSRDTLEHLAEELADVIHCTVLVAITAGIDLQSAVIDKFNSTTLKNGLATLLACSSPPAVEPVVNWDDADDPAAKLFVGFDVEAYVEEYELEGENSSYSPNEYEKVLLTDAIYGVVSNLHEELRKIIPSNIAAPTPHASTDLREENERLKVEAECMRARAEAADDEIHAIAAHLDCESDRDSILHAIGEIEADFSISKDRADALKERLERVEGLLPKAEQLVLTAIQRMRAGHVACLDLTNEAETFLRARAVLAPEGKEMAQHSDDIAVDRFAAVLKAKLAKKRAEGKSGWDDPEECSAIFLSTLLREHTEKGDPLDVGNFAMMLHQRNERIASLRDCLEGE